MNTKVLPMRPAVVPTPDDYWPEVPFPDPFPPAPQIAAALARMAQERAEIDRRHAEELARLRAIQDRD